MIKSKEVKVFTLSVLCCAVLTACGGGSEGSLFIDNSGNNTNSGGNNPSTDNNNNSPSTDDSPSNEENGPTSNHFLNSGVENIPQQNKLIVASIRSDKTKYSEVNFTQPGIVSEVCNFKQGDCTNSAVESLEKEIERDKKKISDQISELEKKIADEKTSSQDKEEFKKEIEKLEKKQLALDDKLPKEGKRVIRDINKAILRTSRTGTVDIIDPDDFQPIKANINGTVPLVLQDAGIIKRNELVKENGTREVVGGLIHRDFNGVMLFQPVGDNDGKYVDAYMRDPAAPGWSYQTFGIFSDNQLTDDNKRDLNVGYQSIGDRTKNVPTNIKATYKGISHAYYNDKQVTSHNRIDVDFSSRTVKYRTDGIPLLHSFEGNPEKHILEEKSDYAVSADATFSSGKSHFKGTATTPSGLTGKIEGQFYGPNAEEIGGVYGLYDKEKNGNVHYVGGFGAKR